MMGYSMPLGFLFLLAVAVNVDGQESKGLATTPSPHKSIPSLPPTTSETNNKSVGNGSDKFKGKMHSPTLEPTPHKLNATAKQHLNAATSTAERSPGEEPRAKPEQAVREGEMRAPPKSDDRGNRGQASATTPAATCGSGALTANLGIFVSMVLSMVLSPLLCF